MRNKPIVNIYNFIRMSHVEPSVFIPDDFETVRNQITLVRQYGLPATYALKYDALLDSRYQELIRTYTAETDEISAWWEISEPLCRKAGVPFRGVQSEEFDERVNSAYSIGYAPEERRRLVDAYMADFREIYGFYPRTIGSWVLDTVTISYAAEKYGILGSAICRDQMGTDGFTLWGGFPNGIYYPSRKNENIPANTAEGQLNVPMFRLLGPDPIYNFEQDVRPGLFGVLADRARSQVDLLLFQLPHGRRYPGHRLCPCGTGKQLPLGEHKARHGAPVKKAGIAAGGGQDTGGDHG